MRYEIELSDDLIFKRVREELDRFARISSWGETSGSVTAVVNEQVKRQVGEQVDAIDLSGLIQREIKAYLMPTLTEVIRKQIEAEAKKQVKLAMNQKEAK